MLSMKYLIGHVLKLNYLVFFIKLLTNKDDVVYDPFSGRGTSVIEAALLERNIISNDVNPLSKILEY